MSPAALSPLMTDPRVVSLAPSATATLAAMDAADLLVGVTAHCEVPAVPERRGAGDASPTRIGGWLNPDPERVTALDPDLILTSDPLQADLADEFRERGHAVHHAEPATLAEVLDSFVGLGTAVDRPAAGRDLRASARDRLDRVADAVAPAVAERGRPVVYCEEWSDPPMAAGNWVPDAVRAAGGRYPFVDPGERSREVAGEVVEAADPDHVVLHVCGRGERSDPDAVRSREWAIDAPIHVVDDDLLNQPSPALIDGVERLAELLHPEALDADA